MNTRLGTCRAQPGLPSWYLPLLKIHSPFFAPQYPLLVTHFIQQGALLWFGCKHFPCGLDLGNCTQTAAYGWVGSAGSPQCHSRHHGVHWHLGHRSHGDLWPPGTAAGVSKQQEMPVSATELIFIHPTLLRRVCTPADTCVVVYYRISPDVWRTQGCTCTPSPDL